MNLQLGEPQPWSERRDLIEHSYWLALQDLMAEERWHPINFGKLLEVELHRTFVAVDDVGDLLLPTGTVLGSERQLLAPMPNSRVRHLVRWHCNSKIDEWKSTTIGTQTITYGIAGRVCGDVGNRLSGADNCGDNPVHAPVAPIAA